MAAHHCSGLRPSLWSVVFEAWSLKRVSHLPWLLVRERNRTIPVLASPSSCTIWLPTCDGRSLPISARGVWVALLWAHFVDPLDVIIAFVEDSDDHAHVCDWFGLRKSLVMRCLWLEAVVGMKEGS